MEGVMVLSARKLRTYRIGSQSPDMLKLKLFHFKSLITSNITNHW